MDYDEFNWATMAIEPHGRLVSYRLGVREMVCLMGRPDGTRLSRLYMHLDGDKPILRDCRSYETG